MGNYVNNLAHAASQSLLAVQLNNNNLANANTVGFKEEHINFEPVVTGANGALVSSANQIYYNMSQGHIQVTDRNLDVAVGNHGFLAIQSPDGQEVYSKSGGLQISSDRFLVDANGNYVLGEQGPISIPFTKSMQIGSNGSVMVEPQNSTDHRLVEIGRLKLVTPPESQLTKSEDGYFRLPSGETVFENPAARLQSGELEGSNVNPVEGMVNLIELSRNYDQYIKMIRMQNDNDAQAQRIITD